MKTSMLLLTPLLDIFRKRQISSHQDPPILPLPLTRILLPDDMLLTLSLRVPPSLLEPQRRPHLDRMRPNTLPPPPTLIPTTSSIQHLIRTPDSRRPSRPRSTTRRSIRLEPSRSRDQRFEARCANGDHGDEGFARRPPEGDGEAGDVFHGVVGAQEGGDHDEDSGREEAAEHELLGCADARGED